MFLQWILKVDVNKVGYTNLAMYERLDAYPAEDHLHRVLMVITKTDSALKTVTAYTCTMVSLFSYFNIYWWMDFHCSCSKIV